MERSTERQGSAIPIYEYACAACGERRESIRQASEVDAPAPECHGPMERIMSAASFNFRTLGGNTVGFSGAHGPMTKGNKRPKTISRGNGLGGHRPPPKIVRTADGKVGVV